MTLLTWAVIGVLALLAAVGAMTVAVLVIVWMESKTWR